MFNLGLCFFKGDGVEQDYEQAAEWLQRSASLGNEQAAAFLVTVDGLDKRITK